MQIRDYVQQAQRDPSRENIEAMWRAVYMLKAWYFVPSEPEGGPTRPMVTTIEGQAWLPAFTNVRRFRDFADSTGRVGESGELEALILDPGESMERIVEVADAIAGVVFNPGSEIAFRAPVDALESYAGHFDLPGFSS